MTVWLVAEFDWDLFRDDLESVELMLPGLAYSTPEAAMAAVQANIDAQDAEVDAQGGSWGPEDKIGKLKWAMVDDCWVANLSDPEEWPDQTSTVAHYVRVYPVEVQS